MTISEARKALERQLVFGDLEQIEALKLLDKASACRDAILACENLDEHLTGRWLDARDCDCNYSFPDEIVKAALSEAKSERRHKTTR